MIWVREYPGEITVISCGHDDKFNVRLSPAQTVAAFGQGSSLNRMCEYSGGLMSSRESVNTPNHSPRRIKIDSAKAHFSQETLEMRHPRFVGDLLLPEADRPAGGHISVFFPVRAVDVTTLGV